MEFLGVECLGRVERFKERGVVEYLKESGRCHSKSNVGTP